jgi:hypothetical protein
MKDESAKHPRVYAAGHNPASFATRIGPGGKPPPKKDPGPEPPEPPEWKTMNDVLRTMSWVMNYDDRWDHLRGPRQQVRKWLNDNPKRFKKQYWKWYWDWCMEDYCVESHPHGR